MDWNILEDVGSLLMKIKMYPYFDVAHYLLMCLFVRDDISQMQSASPYFSKKHPLACWLSSMLLCFGGGILAHFLLGEPVLDDFKNHQNLLVATIVWYLVFYSPFDLIYKLGKFIPIKIILCTLKEIQRTRKIFEGVSHAFHLFPNAYIIIVIIGSVKGAGSGFMSVIDRFIRGIWIPNANEILNPSFATKGCLAASIIFLLERKSIILVPRPLVYLCVALLFVYVKIISLFFKSFDPFVPFENLFSAIFFGGLIDAFRKANVNQTQNTQSSTQSSSTSTLIASQISQGRKENSEVSNKMSNGSTDGDLKSKDNKKKE